MVGQKDIDDSDIDLFVLKDDLRRPVERNRDVRRLLFGIVHPIDIFVRTPREYDRLRNVVGSLPYEAAHEGRVLYERGPRKGRPRGKVDGARQG